MGKGRLFINVLFLCLPFGVKNLLIFPMKEDFSKNLMEINGRIIEACELYNRDADDIEIVAVSKRFPPAYIKIAVASGIHNIGESRVQEADDKIAELGTVARFHMIGHLQTNKAKKAVELFDVIQSVDSLKLGKEINKRAAEIDRTIDCLIEVNTSGEDSKFGIKPSECIELVKQINDMENINLIGLMTIGPNVSDEDYIRGAFASCYELFVQGKSIVGNEFDTLSMGMSDDFELAIAEGSTMIRVGTALFGPRPSK